MAVSFVNGINVHYRLMPARDPVTAPPPTVVFIHGLGTDSLASFYLTLAAPVAAAGIDVLAYDLRGHGRTDRPGTDYRLGDFVADLDGLLDQLRIEQPVHLVGNSFGGTIAFGYAAANPHRVATIVSIEAEPPTASWAEKMRRTLDNTVKELGRAEFLDWVTATFGTHQARLTRAAGVRLSATTMAEDVTCGVLLDAQALWSIRCPVLSVLGSEGFQQDAPTALEAALPDCRTEVLPGQDHSVLVRAHRRVRTLVLDWVAGHTAVEAP